MHDSHTEQSDTLSLTSTLTSIHPLQPPPIHPPTHPPIHKHLLPHNHTPTRLLIYTNLLVARFLLCKSYNCRLTQPSYNFQIFLEPEHSFSSPSVFLTWSFCSVYFLLSLPLRLFLRVGREGCEGVTRLHLRVIAVKVNVITINCKLICFWY